LASVSFQTSNLSESCLQGTTKKRNLPASRNHDTGTYFQNGNNSIMKKKESKTKSTEHQENTNLTLLIASIIYWFLYPFRNSYKNKLKALLEGLETQNVDKLIKQGKTGDFRNYGKAYMSAVRDKVEAAKTCH
jgi:hypothetical protein